MVPAVAGNCQKMELGLNLYPGLAHTKGWDPGMNGAGMEIDYLHMLGAKVQIKGGLELAYCGWGSQGLMTLGIRYGGANALEAEILNGLAFYRQGPSYLFGSGMYYTRSFFRGGKNQLSLSIGLRYTLQPAYKAYSPIYSYVDLPIRIRWSRQLSIQPSLNKR